MRKKIFKRVTGTCSVTNNEISVEIEYSELPVAGSTSEHYKATSVDCPYADTCPDRLCSIAKENLTIEI